jgi:hypothetical protein
MSIICKEEYDIFNVDYRGVLAVRTVLFPEGKY